MKTPQADGSSAPLNVTETPAPPKKTPAPPKRRRGEKLDRGDPRPNVWNLDLDSLLLAAA